MALVDSEPIQPEQNRRQEECIDIISYEPFPMWSVIRWWNASFFWQYWNHGTFDVLGYIRGKHRTVGWRRSFDPYVHRKELYSPSKIDTTPPSTQLPDFKYQQLPSTRHVRLVHILKGPKDSPLNIQFTAVELVEGLLFEALSYVWGVKRHYRVNCEGASLVVRQNLYNALQALRSIYETRVFWIDALCIDQDNHEERRQQVEMMCEIYAASQRTMIWLGAKDAASSETIALLKKIANVPHNTETKNIFNENESIWKGLGALYQNPWFYRIWIIQEVAVASNVAVMLNQDEIWEWDVFAQTSRVALDKFKAWQTVFDPVSVVRLDFIRAQYLTSGRFPRMLHALAHGRVYLATLDVDKIYAVLGLSKDTFKVDYKEPVVNTYVRFAAHIIAQPDGLALLDHVEDHVFRLKVDLPSWVPDWEVRQGPQLLKSSPSSGLWNASFGATAYAQLSAKERHLNVRGIVVDTLYHIGDLFIEEVPIAGAPKNRTPQSAFGGWYLRQRRDLTQVWAIRRVQQWYKLAMEYAKMYEKQDKRYEAYLYTLVAGHLTIDPVSLAFLKRSYGIWCKVWTDAASNDFSTALSAYGDGSPDMYDAMGFMQMHVGAAWHRRIFTTRWHGVMGLCPASARKGDMVVIIHGVSTPCVLRRHRNGSHRFVGQCYAHGLMHGEAKEIFNHCKVTQFELV